MKSTIKDYLVKDKYTKETYIKKTAHYPHESETEQVKEPMADHERALLDADFNILLDAFPQFTGMILLSTFRACYRLECGEYKFIFRYDPLKAKVEFQHRVIDPETLRGKTLYVITHDVYKNDGNFNVHCMLDEFFEWSSEIMCDYE